MFDQLKKFSLVAVIHKLQDVSARRDDGSGSRDKEIAWVENIISIFSHIVIKNTVLICKLNNYVLTVQTNVYTLSCIIQPVIRHLV